MGVPNSEKETAPSEFVMQSIRLLSNIESLCRKLPKRWHETSGELLESARHIAKFATKANSVYAATVPEYDLRLRWLNDVYTECNYLSLRIAEIYRKHPVTYKTETLPDGSTEQVETECFTEKKLISLNESIEKLRKLLHGQIETYRAYRAKQIWKERQPDFGKG